MTRRGVLRRITPYLDWNPVEVDIAIEAASENLDVKLDIFKRLDAVTPPSAILASNTSSISITKLAAATGRPELVIGMHYMNPVPVMKLVEVIRGIATSEATYEFVRNLAVAHGKTPVEVRNFPGFVSNRILCPMLNEAIFALYEGVGSVESIDTVMKLGMNHPMGPFELADFIGLDTLLWRSSTCSTTASRIPSTGRALCSKSTSTRVGSGARADAASIAIRVRAAASSATAPPRARSTERAPVSLDLAAAPQFSLTAEQREIATLARDFAAREIAPHIARWDREHVFPRDLYAKLGDAGLMGLTIPERFGGAGADYVSYALALEELARVDAGTRSRFRCI
jgi:3-hydroxyacyl-CoA dehydrogenase